MGLSPGFAPFWKPQFYGEGKRSTRLYHTMSDVSNLSVSNFFQSERKPVYSSERFLSAHKQEARWDDIIIWSQQHLMLSTKLYIPARPKYALLLTTSAHLIGSLLPLHVSVCHIGESISSIYSLSPMISVGG